MILPLNANIHKRAFKILDIQIVIRTHKQLIEELSDLNFKKYNTFNANFGSIDLTEDAPYYLSTSHLGYNLYDAWHNWEDIYVTFQGALNFSLSLGSWNLSLSPGRSRAKVQYPDRIYATRSTFRWYMPLKKLDDSKRDFVNLSRVQVSNLNCVLELLSKTPGTGTLSDLISNCMRLYHHAIYAINNYQSFLNFWQLAENITLSDRFYGTTNKVMSRIGWHLDRYKKDLIGGSVKSTLTSIKNTRNKVVHRGLQKVNLDDINILKLICEDAIIWLIRGHRILKDSDDLEEFYQIRTKSSRDLILLNTEISRFLIDERNAV